MDGLDDPGNLARSLAEGGNDLGRLFHRARDQFDLGRGFEDDFRAARRILPRRARDARRFLGASRRVINAGNHFRNPVGGLARRGDLSIRALRRLARGKHQPIRHARDLIRGKQDAGDDSPQGRHQAVVGLGARRDHRIRWLIQAPRQVAVIARQRDHVAQGVQRSLHAMAEMHPWHDRHDRAEHNAGHYHRDTGSPAGLLDEEGASTGDEQAHRDMQERDAGLR